MTFNPLIPLVTDPILQSYFQLRANFQAINTTFAEDHVSYNQNQEFAGMHNVLSMAPQNADPATSATQIALYNKLVTSVPALFYRPSSSQTPIQLTYPSIQTGLQPSGVYYPQQYTFVAGPFVIYAGILKDIVAGQNVTLSPFATLLYADLVVANSTISPSIPAYAIATNLTGSTFTIQYQANEGPTATIHMDAYYFAIGM
jgi:hypothetical protein